MGTAKQLVSAFVEATPLTWDRSYSKNMRPIRGYPDYWRIIDTEAYVDGPPSLGTVYNKDLYIWQAKILEDEDGNLTNSFEISNLGDYLTETSEVVNGETVYRYKYNSDVESYTYSHTSVIDSISLEFDQLGRRLIAFESAGDINFVWYDPQAGQTVTTNFGAGHTPYVVTDTYRRTGGSADSERLLFYVKGSTKQIVYRRQNDRYQTEYALPTAPNDVVEIIQVSKNLYGGLTVLYCYEDTVTGELVTGSYTARHGVDQIAIGTDGYIKDTDNFYVNSGTLSLFSLEKAVIEKKFTNTVLFTPSNGIITNFVLRSVQTYLNEQTEEATTLSISNGAITGFHIEAPIAYLDMPKEGASLGIPTSTVVSFTLKETKITHNSTPSTASLLLSSGDVILFTLG